MAIKIRKHIVSPSVAKNVTYSGTNSKDYIIVHETDNTSKGADADAHGRLQANGNSRSASWHFSVDDKEIVQSFDESVQCWAAGSVFYNKNGINIEICVNSDGDYVKAVELASKLVAYLMDKHGIPVSRVIQHNMASGKHCPRKMREGYKGVNWAKFKRMVTGDTNAPTSSKKPHKPSVSAPKPSSSGKAYTGGSITMYLQSIGKPSSFKAREKLAKEYGISGYKGTANQNRKLLSLLRGGKPVSKPKPKTSASLTVDGKWGASTTKSLQRALGTKVDGVISSQPSNSVTNALYGGVTFGSKGSPLVKALQRKVGAKADGKLGPDTVRKLQAYLGTTQDGKISRPSAVVKAMQRKLNNGTF